MDQYPSSKKKYCGQDTMEDSPDLFDKMVAGPSKIKTLREKIMPWMSQDPNPAKEDQEQRTGEGVSSLNLSSDDGTDAGVNSDPFIPLSRSSSPLLQNDNEIESPLSPDLHHNRSTTSEEKIEDQERRRFSELMKVTQINPGAVKVDRSNLPKFTKYHFEGLLREAWEKKLSELECLFTNLHKQGLVHIRIQNDRKWESLNSNGSRAVRLWSKQNKEKLTPKKAEDSLHLVYEESPSVLGKEERKTETALDAEDLIESFDDDECLVVNEVRKVKKEKRQVIADFDIASAIGSSEREPPAGEATKKDGKITKFFRTRAGRKSETGERKGMCPMCELLFSLSRLEAHAAECNGKRLVNTDKPLDPCINLCAATELVALCLKFISQFSLMKPLLAI